VAAVYGRGRGLESVGGGCFGGIELVELDGQVCPQQPLYEGRVVAVDTLIAVNGLVGVD
jgi:hypothetical protein